MLKNCIFGVCDKRERTLLDRQRDVRSRISKNLMKSRVRKRKRISAESG